MTVGQKSALKADRAPISASGIGIWRSLDDPDAQEPGQGNICACGEQCCASAHFGAHVGKTCRKDRQDSDFAIPAACHLELAVRCSLS